MDSFPLPGAIDTMVHANPPLGPASDRPNPLGAALVRQTAAELVEEMDRLGVARAIIGPPAASAGIAPEAGYRWTLEAVQQFPDRLALAVGVDPTGLMTAVRQLESMVKNDGAVTVRLAPFRVGKPLTDRVYFPLYTKCVELGVPVTTPVGLPGPRLPGMMQHPQYLDELAYLWPELTIVTSHGGEPWTKLLVQLMAKWPNIYHVLSAMAPKYYPKDTIAFLNSSRGRTKVLFGTDHPFMPMQRVASELADAGIDEGARAAFLHDNADRIYFGGAASLRPESASPLSVR
jgi:predicted TIM-barrel fold metal-dependent hydrolase